MPARERSLHSLSFIFKLIFSTLFLVMFWMNEQVLFCLLMKNDGFENLLCRALVY